MKFTEFEIHVIVTFLMIIGIIPHIFLIFSGLNSAVRVVRSPPRVGDHGEDNTRRAFIAVGAIFVTSFVALFYIYLKFPELES
jgi:ABC-type glycerol-3-phosphate transport system permease component